MYFIIVHSLLLGNQRHRTNSMDVGGLLAESRDGINKREMRTGGGCSKQNMLYSYIKRNLMKVNFQVVSLN